MRKGKLILTMTLLFVCLIPVTANGQGVFGFDFSGEYRIRGIYGYNGIISKLMASEMRLAMQLQGIKDIDQQLGFMDTRLRLRLSGDYKKTHFLVTYLEIGDIVFGDFPSGGFVGFDMINVRTKNLYLELNFLNNQLRLRGGIHTLSLPKGLILFDDCAGISAQYMFSGIKSLLYGAYIRAFDNTKMDYDLDGLIDNSWMSRDVYILGFNFAKLRQFRFDLYSVLEHDNALGPVNRKLSSWNGISMHLYLGRFSSHIDYVFNYGESYVDDQKVFTRAHAFDANLLLDLDWLKLELSGGFATGKDPRSKDNNAFQFISPSFQQSNILYDTYGMYILNSKSLSGTGYISLRVSTSPFLNFLFDILVLYASYMEKPDVTNNIYYRRDNNKEIGWEFDFNIYYQILDWLQVFLVNGILIPRGGFQAHFDSPSRKPIIEIIGGIIAKY